MKKVLFCLMLAGFLGGGFIQAQETEIEYYNQQGDLPDGTYNEDFSGIIPPSKKEYYDYESEEFINDTYYEQETISKIGKRIEEGTVSFSDVPVFIVGAINLFTKLAGSVAILFLIYGGIQYMLGELTEQKDQAKKTIMYAIGGLIVVFLAWLIVNIVKTQFTGVDYYGNTVEESR